MAGNDFDNKVLDRFFKGEHSEMDLDSIDKLFCDDDKVAGLKSHMSKQFNELLHEDDLNEKNLDPILYRIHYDINTGLPEKKTSVFKNILKWTLRVAGIILLPLVIIIGIQNYEENIVNKETWVEITAPAWTRAQFRLPDGTTGWLNSNSSIKYKGNFSSDRKVNITGEAFFDVVKNKEKPFIVNTNDVMVTVLGTRFNIASYENEKDVEVVLEEGKLIFNDTKMNKSYTMKPNDLVVYDKQLRNFSTEVVQPQKYLSWTEGKLVFRNDPVDVIARRLERWYNIDVEVKGNLTEDLRLRATFIDEGFEQVLTLLKRSLPINYKLEYGDIRSDGTYVKTKVVISPRTK